METLSVGDVFTDKDRYRSHLRGSIRVVGILHASEHAIKEPVAVCVERMKPTLISVRRLTGPTRFERSHPINP